ncbi:replication initiation protein [Fibrella forsythiae]|uniref:Replication initiation protein n=1 Tax=Fibrella forsythiae TaxID=2817061 RepID=A0ABS3JVL2_9BACT|nr:replication initiation protein [Fibrella forsythiae]MBO0953219.1 replication initiation protein [Fibrella forsythiae]
MAEKPVLKDRAQIAKQFELFALEPSQLQKLAQYVQEPLELLLAKTEKHLSIYDRRIYWTILTKLASFQTRHEEEVPVPMTNPVFLIPIRDLYPQFVRDQFDISDSGEQADPPLRSQASRRRRGSLTAKIGTYSFFKSLAQDLVSKSVINIDHMTTLDPKNRLVGTIAIFPSVFYRDGILSVEVDRKVVPAMCMLGKGYTKFKREEALALSRTASQILYVRLCRLLDFRIWRTGLDELRVILEAESYARYSNFKQKVLLPVIQEINDYTDLFVSFSEVKEGKAVVKIEFTFYHQAEKPKQELKQARQKLDVELDNIYALPLAQRRMQVADLIAKHYTFSATQRQLILENEGKLNQFIELHLKYIDGIITIKTSPTRYMAPILFPKARQSSSTDRLF